MNTCPQCGGSGLNEAGTKPTTYWAEVWSYTRYGEPIEVVDHTPVRGPRVPVFRPCSNPDCYQGTVATEEEWREALGCPLPDKLEAQP